MHSLCSIFGGTVGIFFRTEKPWSRPPRSTKPDRRFVSMSQETGEIQTKIAMDEKARREQPQQAQQPEQVLAGVSGV